MKDQLLILAKKNASWLMSVTIFFALLTHSYGGFASTPIEKRPQTVTQPDGTVLHIFTSGDQYYHWLHDANNYTIVVDQKGYFVYADVVNGMLIPTKYVVGKFDPASVRLSPGLNYSDSYIAKLRDSRGANKLYPSFVGTIKEKQGGERAEAKFTGAVMNPLVVFIRFKGESEVWNTKTDYYNSFNDDPVSLKNYYLWNSYNTLTITSTILGGTATTIASYQDTHARGYFSPYNDSTNTGGYKTEDIQVSRERTLLKNAINAMKGFVPKTLNLDANDDGNIDMVFFVISGVNDPNGGILWPHRSWLGNNDIKINSKMPNDYMLVFQGWRDVGLLCHETGHVLGAPDYYRYVNKEISPVATWDVMSNQTNPPQSMSSYTKWKYMGFTASIPEITKTGWYTLSPVGEGKSAYKIRSTKTGEFFILEYRKKTAASFESAIPGSGLIVYRVNSNMNGNGNTGVPDKNTGVKPVDELYVYRPGGTNNTTNGTVANAFFSTEAKRTEFGDNTSPNSFMTDGTLGRLNISNISSAGNTIKFYYRQTCMSTSSIATVNYTSASNPPALTEATSSITTTGALNFPSGKVATFRSARVILRKGFHAFPGAKFYAVYSNCSYKTIPSVARIIANTEILVSEESEFEEINSAQELFDVWPNPATQFINIDPKKDIDDKAYVEIYNSSGVKIYHNPVNELNEKLLIDLKNRPTGLYYLKVTSGKDTSTKPFIIK